MPEPVSAPETWFVYVLRCRGDRLYCGITNDLDARWSAHVAGKGARFTRSFPPLAVIGVVAVAGRSEALKLEALIKRLPRAGKLKALAARQSPCAAVSEGDQP